jgi:hypothetical protein
MAKLARSGSILIKNHENKRENLDLAREEALLIIKIFSITAGVMTNRMYRGLLGTLILIFLYIDHAWLIYCLSALLFFEGISGLTLPHIFNRLSGLHPDDEESQIENPWRRWDFSAERGWRLLVAALLLLSCTVLYRYMWLIPWYFGLAILGSALSSICPALIMLRRLGFR